MINWTLYKLYALIQTTFNFVISSKVEAQKNEGYSSSRCNGCHRIWWADLLSRMGHACKIFLYVRTDVTKKRFNIISNASFYFFVFYTTEDPFACNSNPPPLCIVICWNQVQSYLFHSVHSSCKYISESLQQKGWT